MFTFRNRRKNHATDFSSMPAEGIVIEACSNRKNLPITKVISTSWHKTNKVFMIRMCLLLIVGFVSCEGILEYAKLKQLNAANNSVISNYALTIGTLSKERSNLNIGLTAASTGPVPKESIQATAMQQTANNVVSAQVNEFASYTDLVNWLKQDNTHEQEYSPTFQCVDFAMMMSEHAYKQGYWIFPAVDLADGHMRCIVPINGYLYAVEPQTNDVSLWAVKSDP